MSLFGDSRLPGFDGATGWLNSPPLTVLSTAPSPRSASVMRKVRALG